MKLDSIEKKIDSILFSTMKDRKKSHFESMNKSAKVAEDRNLKKNILNMEAVCYGGCAIQIPRW